MIMIEKISVDELMQMQKIGSDIIIVDVRNRQEYLNEHIPDAINIIYDDLNKTTKYDFETYLINNNINLNGKFIIVYCDRGGRSIYFTRFLIECGYHAASLSGGYRSYNREKLKHS